MPLIVQRADQHSPPDTSSRPGPARKFVLVNEPDDVDRIWLLSVRHTGTHYMYEFLRLCGYDLCSVHWRNMTQKNVTGQHQLIHSHIEIGRWWESYLTTERVVIPVRNPVEVFKTHVYRYAWDADEYVPYVLSAFSDLEDIVERHDVILFRVDAPDQRAEFRSLARYLDCPDAEFVGQPTDIGTDRPNAVTTAEGFTADQAEMFHNPPADIWELSRRFGY